MSKPDAVSEFITSRIAACGKSQVQIASEAGFDKPNMITMIKLGSTKLPLQRVGSLAAALETDPVHLYKLCMTTYEAKTWDAITPFADFICTSDEIELIKALRLAGASHALVALTEASRAHLDKFIASVSASAGSALIQEGA